MKKLIFLGFLCFLYGYNLNSQTTSSIRGKIIESTSKNPLKNVSVALEGNLLFTKTALNGDFHFKKINKGNYYILINFDGYFSQKIPINILDNTPIDLGIIYLQPIFIENEDSNLISLTDDDLLDDSERSSDYTSGLFQSSKDAYLKAAAFNFSQAWFKVRGYDSRYGTISINGIEMNKLYDGRPQWSNWGGLNDALRNQEFSNGISPSENTFGGILGTTNFITRASEYQAVSKVSLSSTNRSYTGRIMATYASGLLKNNWAFVVSGSRRTAQNGYFEGTTYNSWAGFIATEKIFNEHHSLNFTAFTSSNRRGKSSPNTQEVYDLRGYKYNSYWGNQEGDKRNSRIKEIFEPVVMLTHFYDNENFFLETTMAYQFGHIGNSRLGYFNAPNPDPTYWKYLPSSFLRFEDNLDYANAYLTEQEFLNNGQINWSNLYQINADNGNSLYYLYEDRVDDTQLSFNSKLNANLKDNINLNAGFSYKNLTSENYGNMLDLLGGNGFVDLDQYAIGDAQQNDLNNPNKLILENDKFQYNYTINAAITSAFAQIQSSQKKIDYFIGLNFMNTYYQRNGLFKNGTYATNSFGKGKKQSFSNFSTKIGLTYKYTGRHLVNINGAYVSNAPTIKTSFSNARVNNSITPNLTSEKIVTGDINYIFRSPKILSRLTAYYTKFSDGIETSFFFAEGLLGDQADFVNEIITGVNKKHIGVELSAEYQATSTIKLIIAGSFGQFTYDNNPQLYLQSESFIDENSDFGISYLKNYRISGTPQSAYSLGFEYRDPNYWWFQTNANLLSNNYLDISPLLRTDNFYIDADGVPFVDDKTGVEVTQNQVDALLKQEKFEAAFLVNIVGGKSWRIKGSYLGFFAGINNVLGEVFKTGGFEQSRNANYPELKQDNLLKKPIFGPKYWYGNDTSYYLNLYIRF
ncbi:outer membrane receptor protein involved in Fe transport [Lutibacter oceani]|uniref:Outer membrane receptor protein involved in Fe transport n=1 Tax=Lutibacter oceani TaxID=1853311 RepID=A0A3D9S3N5_9FLAO|nr:TonB-dependent receptor [Lutibacter oceani]REE83455.1 outer membrane receptor protein involved in Fe transport [Lutibacter oceani]